MQGDKAFEEIENVPTESNREAFTIDDSLRLAAEQVKKHLDDE